MGAKTTLQQNRDKSNIDSPFFFIFVNPLFHCLFYVIEGSLSSRQQTFSFLADSRYVFLLRSLHCSNAIYVYFSSYNQHPV